MNVLEEHAREEKAPFLGEDLELDRRLGGDPPQHLGSTARKVEWCHGCGGAPETEAKEGGEQLVPPRTDYSGRLLLLFSPWASASSLSPPPRGRGRKEERGEGKGDREKEERLKTEENARLAGVAWHGLKKQQPGSEKGGLFGGGDERPDDVQIGRAHV